MWYLYVVKCSDNSLYCGITKNVQARVEVHNKGKGSKYTRSRLPVVLDDFCKVSVFKSDALKVEYAFKRLRKKQKIEILNSGLANFSKEYLRE
mgnify:CR=1 FL=1